MPRILSASVESSQVLGRHTLTKASNGDLSWGTNMINNLSWLTDISEGFSGAGNIDSAVWRVDDTIDQDVNIRLYSRGKAAKVRQVVRASVPSGANGVYELTVHLGVFTVRELNLALESGTLWRTEVRIQPEKVFKLISDYITPSATSIFDQQGFAIVYKALFNKLKDAQVVVNFQIDYGFETAAQGAVFMTTIGYSMMAQRLALQVDFPEVDLVFSLEPLDYEWTSEGFAPWTDDVPFPRGCSWELVGL